MKATGIVRRIDELGRVIIPKEIRRTMRIREGDPLEIFTDREGEIILKKYSPIGEMGDFARHFSESLHKTTGHIACISNRDCIVAVSGAMRRDYMDHRISNEIENVMTNRKAFQSTDKNTVSITFEESNGSDYTCQTIVPIVVDGEPVGAIILASKDSGVIMRDMEMAVCQTAASFMAKQLEQ